MEVMKHHPYVLFIVRECENAVPTVMARYDYGVERRFKVENFDKNQIEDLV
jgi:hypothetical protein